MNWHALEVAAVVNQLQTHVSRGLSAIDAGERLKLYGPNTLRTEIAERWYTVLLRQFTGTMMFILAVAAVVSAAIGELADAVAILAIVVFNGALGFLQEWKAEKALVALKSMLAPVAMVVRDGEQQQVDAATLVPGDVVMLDVGDRVPADLRLVEGFTLKVDESPLTGESAPVEKHTCAVVDTAPLAERSSMLWMGTSVAYGRGAGVVVATGMATEFGKIARLTGSIDRETTPLQRKLGRLGRQLGIVAVLVSIVVGVTGWFAGKPLIEMFLVGISLAVAAVPEGLPAVVTITLALGIRSMAQRNALIRRLPAAETLGAATVVCTDKTGTLTRNEMTVRKIWLRPGYLSVTGVGYEPAGDFFEANEPVGPENRPDLISLARTGMICNHARIYKDANGWRQIGDPTEAALLVLAEKAGLRDGRQREVLAEIPFSAERKRMTVIQRTAGKTIAYAKGAPEMIIERSARVLDKTVERAMTESDRAAAYAAYQSLASEGLRTLALASRELDDAIAFDEDSVERELTFLGIVGIIDPARPEVPNAMELSRSAGIRVIMITGDASATAAAVARDIGMEKERAIDGAALNRASDEQLKRLLDDDVLFARTSPEHKMRIVNALQSLNHVVAMTGDGVNDAPALKQADIGIAMGVRGTDVAKGAADMILTDDNFASIIAAVEEGRRQYDNIKKFVHYLLSSNAAEIIAILVNILSGSPLILLPVQILWINLITDGLTALALGVEPASKDTMQRPPRDPDEGIVGRAGLVAIMAIGAYMGLATVWLFDTHLASSGVDFARTVAFTGLIVMEKFNVFNFRSLRQPLSTIGLFSNPWLLAAWAGALAAQLAAVYVPFLQGYLDTKPISVAEWILILALAFPVLIAGEVYKLWRLRSSRTPS